MPEGRRDLVATKLLALIPFYHKHVFRNSRVTGIQVARYRALGVLLKSGPQSMSEIGRRLYISRQYMTAHSDTLIAESLVDRVRGSDDRRGIQLSITPEGEKHLGAFLEDLGYLLTDLSDEDLCTLNESLDNLKKILAKTSRGAENGTADIRW
ncbi:MAG: hypothetical protein METHP_00721 [Methanoregula sp. SKADARSKE-2]|nr:MAG: hypothetical protein METHP_00721 [Methanoregula sp. SKADARSKE-2]